MSEESEPGTYSRITQTPVATGNALTELATFSRFVLPFAYEPWLAHESPEINQEYFREATMEDLIFAPQKCAADYAQAMVNTRRDYWTPDTADVIYDSSRWMILAGTDEPRPRQLTVKLPSLKPGGPARELSVLCQSPSLILMEFPPLECIPRLEPMTHRDGNPRDFLKTGFLIWECSPISLSATGGPQWTLGDWLRFNELFRYSALPYPGVREAHCEMFLEKDPNASEPFEKRWAALLERPVRLNAGGGAWVRLIPTQWREETRNWRYPDVTKASLKTPEPSRRGWYVHPDQRSFVYSCVVLPNEAESLRDAVKSERLFFRSPTPELAAWHALVNVDSPPRANNMTPPILEPPSEFDRNWIRKRSYLRWQHRETIYGFCTHSAAMLTSLHAQGNVKSWKHFRDMYFDMVILFLFVRTVLLRLSAGLNLVTRNLKQNGRGHLNELDSFGKQFYELRLQLDLFTNLYQFPLLSNQQQGIEMYKVVRKAMDVDDLFREVQEEVKSTHDMLTSRQSRSIEVAMGWLSVVATVGIPVAIVVPILWQVIADGTVLAYKLGFWLTAAAKCLILLLPLLLIQLAFQFSKKIFRAFYSRIQ